MLTRRRFLGSMSLFPSLTGLSHSVFAAGEPRRIALVIGNDDYAAAPLVNPGNDARAMADLLSSAGFSVSRHLNTKRDEMLRAVEVFANSAMRSETEMALFYYAGHGAQLDWRNYLLPVGAEVKSAEQVKQSCVDLAELLGRVGRVRNKTFIIILDACRNDPFGGRFKPAQQGLSQFDAPVGSLLAYATSPGNVASDGGGQHGLYTENLLRELGQKGTRLEDCLKRVRLNVRLQSNNEQVPWETTSLEQDVFIFPGAAPLSALELERELEEEIAAWQKIKGSHNLDAWAEYLRRFPNGRFSEIAQSRLVTLLAERQPLVQTQALAGKQPSESSLPVTEPASDERSDEQVTVVWNEGKPPKFVWRPSDNPYSAGTYPLARNFSVGDTAVYRESDFLTRVETARKISRVTRVDKGADRVELNNGDLVFDLMGNVLKQSERVFDPPLQIFPAELKVGNKWKAAFKLTRPDGVFTSYYDFQVKRPETIKVPAGEIECFLIDGVGQSVGGRGQAILETRIWVVPGINFSVKIEKIVRNSHGRYIRTEVSELVSLKQRILPTL